MNVCVLVAADGLVIVTSPIVPVPALPAPAAGTGWLFPIVALAVSTVFEGYRWSGLAVVGLLLVVAGNLVAFDLARRLFVRTA